MNDEVSEKSFHGFIFQKKKIICHCNLFNTNQKLTYKNEFNLNELIEKVLT